ncbi:hypothetical protein Tco_0475127 [Tanacetum coccineum]
MEPVPSSTEVNAQVVPLVTSLSTQFSRSPSYKSASIINIRYASSQSQTSRILQNEPHYRNSPITHMYYILHLPQLLENLVWAQSTSRNVNSTEPTQVTQPQIISEMDQISPS